MSWRDAPLYVEAHDLARWVVERVRSWSGDGNEPLAPLVVQEAATLVGAVSLALTFPSTRPAHLEAADHAIVRLRVLLRLARELGLISAGGLRFAADRLQAAGRMVGGWRKRVEKGCQERSSDRVEGTGPQRREAGDPRRLVQEHREQGALRVPEQQEPEEPVEQPGLPRRRPRRPEPAAPAYEGPEQARPRR